MLTIQHTINTKKLAGVGIAAAAALSIAMLIAKPASALVQTADIAEFAVTSTQIAEWTIGGHDMGTNSVGTRAIADFSIGGHDMGDASVGSRALGDGSVLTADLGDGQVTGAKLASDVAIASDITRATSDTGSLQNLAGDLTLQGAAGGTGAFQGGVMGHLHGDTLAPDASSNDYDYHAGVIGAYSVTTSDTAGTKAGVIGVIGVDAATTVPDAAVMAVIDSGDGSATTADAAYGVAYTSPAAGSHFNYGVDLKHAAFTDVGSNSAVDFGVADIRLANGVAILSGTGTPSSSGASTSNCNLGAGKPDLPLGSLYLNASGGTNTSLYLCTATNTWTAK